MRPLKFLGVLVLAFLTALPALALPAQSFSRNGNPIALPSSGSPQIRTAIA